MAAAHLAASPDPIAGSVVATGLGGGFVRARVVRILTDDDRAADAIWAAGKSLLTGIAAGADSVTANTVHAVAGRTLAADRAGSAEGQAQERIGRSRREIDNGVGRATVTSRAPGSVDSRRAHRGVRAATVTTRAAGTVDFRGAHRSVGQSGLRRTG